MKFLLQEKWGWLLRCTRKKSTYEPVVLSFHKFISDQSYSCHTDKRFPTLSSSIVAKLHIFFFCSNSAMFSLEMFFHGHPHRLFLGLVCMAQSTIRGGYLKIPLSDSSTQFKIYLELRAAKPYSHGLVYEENR